MPLLPAIPNWLDVFNLPNIHYMATGSHGIIPLDTLLIAFKAAMQYLQ